MLKKSNCYQKLVLMVEGLHLLILLIFAQQQRLMNAQIQLAVESYGQIIMNQVISIITIVIMGILGDMEVDMGACMEVFNIKGKF